MKPSLKVILAIRRLQFVGKEGKEVVVKLGTPKKVAKGEWACPYLITGLQSKGIQYAYGIDGIQSLIMALEGVRNSLKAYQSRLYWVGGKPGDIGFPCFVPAFYGLKFSKKLEKLIEREVKQFARKTREKYRKGLKSRDKSKRNL